MNCYNEDIKLEAFKSKTTYLNDYKKYCNIKREDCIPQQIRNEAPPSMIPHKRQYEDHETFSNWKDDVYIPFDLLLYPKPIVQTNPRKPFQKLQEPLREGDKLKAIKTRPRIYMTPACSMDDVPDPEMRQLLCNYMYTSEGRKAELEGTSGFKPKIPNITNIDCTNQVIKQSSPHIVLLLSPFGTALLSHYKKVQNLSFTKKIQSMAKLKILEENVSQNYKVSLQTHLYPPIGEQIKAISKGWDDEQMRGLSDPTRDFWVHKDPPVACGACVNPLQNIVPQKIKNEISQAIADDRLRLAHDLVSPSYAGYKPMLARGTTISRKNLPATHPLLTTAQASTSSYADHNRK